MAFPSIVWFLTDRLDDVLVDFKVDMNVKKL
jgi:hypothetical protein